MGISSLWLVLVGLLVQWNLSSSQCILELSIWNEGVGCNGQADVTITIVANGQCNVDRADEGPGNYIATCDSDGLLFLSSSCIDADCAPPEQDDFFSQGKCDRDSSATAYLYTNDDTPIPLNSCQSLHRTYPPNRVSIMVAGDCTICTEAPSVAPSALSTMAPTNTTSTPSSVPTLDPTAVPSLDSSLAISSMPSDQPSLSPTSVIVVEPPPAPLTQPPVEPPSNNIVPSSIPSQLTNRPSLRPTADAPTSTPVVVTSASAAPSSQPRSAPRPTRRPTRQPTMAPTITAAAPSNAALGESSSTTTTTTNATDTCLLINTNRCESLLSATATVIEEKCDCYTFCDGNFIGCQSLGDLSVEVPGRCPSFEQLTAGCQVTASSVVPADAPGVSAIAATSTGLTLQPARVTINMALGMLGQLLIGVC